MKKTVVLYVCKRDNHCSGSCWVDCRLTSMPEHAVNEECKEPWNYPDRFEKSETSNYIYYIEKEIKEKHEEN